MLPGQETVEQKGACEGEILKRGWQRSRRGDGLAVLIERYFQLQSRSLAWQLGDLREKLQRNARKREGRKAQEGIALFFLSLVCALFCFPTPLLLASRRVAYQFASPYLRKPGTKWTLLQPLVISLCFQPPGSFLSPLHFISFSSFLNFIGALLLLWRMDVSWSVKDHFF